LSLATDAAVQWWSDYLKKYISLENRKKFECSLRDCIIAKIKDHWYPGTPSKGQGYRSLVMDKLAHCDPVLLKAASSAGLSDPFSSYFKDIESVLMWIDPDVVVVRLAYSVFLNIPPEEKILFNSQSSKLPPSTKTPPSSTPQPYSYIPRHANTSLLSPVLSPPSSPSSYHPPNYRPPPPVYTSPSNSHTLPPISTYPSYSSPHKGPYHSSIGPSIRNSPIYYNNNNSSLLLNHQAQYVWYNNNKKKLGEDNIEKNGIPTGVGYHQQQNMNNGNNYYLSKHQNKDILGRELEESLKTQA